MGFPAPFNNEVNDILGKELISQTKQNITNPIHLSEYP